MSALPLVPVPASVTLRGDQVKLGPGAAVVVPVDAVPGLDPVVARLSTRLGAALGAPVPVRTGDPLPGDVHLVLDPSLGEEAYRLVVGDPAEAGPGTIRLEAAGPEGLRHATTTLLALVGLRTGEVDLPGLVIDDAPRYRWRGLHLDVARHFQAVPTVLAVLDVMADLKLNRLHLHLTDDQGWRVALACRPLLTARSGSTEVGDGPGGWYSADDVRLIVAAAADLGIVVVPEIDLPGHTNAAQHAYGELNPGGEPLPAYTGTDVGSSRLHADLPATEPFVREVLAEVAELFGTGYLHVGGDEALTLDRAEFVRLVAIALDQAAVCAAVPVAWQEAAAATPAPGTVLQWWQERLDPADLRAAVAAGSRVLLSPASRTYLDLKYDPDFPLGLEWAGHLPLRRAYEWDPGEALPWLAPEAVEGVEACLWTETVRTPDDLAALMLPRLAAVAEVAWSPAARDWEGFSERVAGVAPGWTERGLAWTQTPDVSW